MAVQSGACAAVAILVGGNMTYEEEEAAFQNHHVKGNPLEQAQTIILVSSHTHTLLYMSLTYLGVDFICQVVMLPVFCLLHLSGLAILPVYIDILLCFSFLSPLNLLSSR